MRTTTSVRGVVGSSVGECGTRSRSNPMLAGAWHFISQIDHGAGTSSRLAKLSQIDIDPSKWHPFLTIWRSRAPQDGLRQLLIGELWICPADRRVECP